MQKASADYSIVLPMAALAPSRGQPRPEDAAIEFGAILATSQAQDAAGGKLAPAEPFIAPRASLVLGDGLAFGADASGGPYSPSPTSLASQLGRPARTPADPTPSPTDVLLSTATPLADLQPVVLADAPPEQGEGEPGDAIPMPPPVHTILLDQAEVSLKPKPKGADRQKDDDADSSAALIGGQSQNPAARPVLGLPVAMPNEPDAVGAHDAETLRNVKEPGQNDPAMEASIKVIGASTLDTPAQPLSAAHASADAKRTSLGANDRQVVVPGIEGGFVDRAAQSMTADELAHVDQDTSGKTAAQAHSFDMPIPKLIAVAAAPAGSVLEPLPSFTNSDPGSAAVGVDRASDAISPLPRAATALQRGGDLSAFTPASMAARSAPLADGPSPGDATPTLRETGVYGPDLVQTSTSRAQAQFMSLVVLPSALFGPLSAPPSLDVEVLADFTPKADADSLLSVASLPSALPPVTVRSDGSLFVPASHLAPQIIAFIETSSDTSTLLALDPEELGSISLRLEADASSPDRMVVMISAERPETLDLFRRHAAELAEALRDAGYSGADIGFSQHEGGGQDTPKDGAKGFLMTHAPDDTANDPARAPTVLGTSLDLRL